LSSPAQPNPSRSRQGGGWRIAAIVLGVVAVLLAAALFALRQAYPPARISAMLAEQISSATGRAFRIDGDLSIHLFPTIAVRANDVALANADWGSQPDMLRFRRAAFEISLRDLLDRQIRILSAEVEGAEILLESDGAGRYNWQFAPNPRDGAKSAPPLEMDRFLVSGAHVTYRDARKGASRDVEIESLDLRAKGERDQLSGVFKVGPQEWKAEGEVGRVARMLAGAEDWPFDIALSTDGAALSAAGSLGTGPRAGSLEAALKLQASDAKVLQPMSAAASALPMPVEATATLRRSPDEWRLDELTLSIAGQALNGRVTLQTSPPRPRVDAELSSAAIDLKKWLTAEPAAAAKTPRAPLFGDKPLFTFDALPEIPLQIHVKVDRLNVPGMPAISGLQARFMSDQGRLTVEPLSFAAAGGAVQGRFELTLRSGAAPRTDLQLTARSLSVEDLDAQRGGKHFKGGRANLDLKLAMTGRTPRSLAGTTNGDVQLSVRDVGLAGRASTLDQGIVARLLDTLLPKQAPSQDLVVQCLVGRLPLRNGVAPIDRSIVMETPQIAVAASGEINLAKQTIELAFLPRVKKGLDLNPGSLVQLLLLKGPLENPEFTIDPKGTVRQAATFGVAAATGGLSLLAPALFGHAGAVKDCGLPASAGGQGTKSKSQQERGGSKFKAPHPFGLIGR
jgi:uncharacterized protein involved in outer membrane biogenesis